MSSEDFHSGSQMRPAFSAVFVDVSTRLKFVNLNIFNERPRVRSCVFRATAYGELVGYRITGGFAKKIYISTK